MRGTIVFLVTFLGLILVGEAEAESVGVNVPGSADPWLAGMPNGSMASSGDVAPAQSPIEVLGLPIIPGTSLNFFATGLTAHGPTQPFRGPDGSGFNEHLDGAENGISNTFTRTDSLQGVFLGLIQPDLTPAPAALDFTNSGNVPGDVNYSSLSPLLKQVFFIGDGITDGGEMQQVVVPAGAMRLFLGTMDGRGWFNNIGLLDVQVTVIPGPTTPALVDIKPGSVPNSVNQKSKGVLPVAILGTADFDVTEVEFDSLLFGDPLLIDNGGTAVSPLRSALEDVSGDGLLDLTLKFSTRDLVEFGALGSDTVEGLLTGALLDGTPFAGMDSIRIVPLNGSNGNSLQISAVPEPTTYTLALAALCLAMSRRRAF